ncbi:ATP-dependent CLP protease [Plasmodium ovale wallikeri]|uniref:ATP-dependent Clp protease proteolytic subunit n=1 Tax=Plasmodium ovale wallikeri TaxID=864142 RepID=A0A1A8YSM5_PLAOA|nr:ATP-dependent CLP protease [Plasmodium ovale wallikeri]
MEVSIDALKEKFLNMNSDIELIERKLKDEMCKMYEDDINPFLILNDFENIKNELSKINKDLDTLYERKKLSINYMHRQMQNYNFLLNLEKNLNISSKEFDNYHNSEIILNNFFYDNIKKFLLNINYDEIKELLHLDYHHRYIVNEEVSPHEQLNGTNNENENSKNLFVDSANVKNNLNNELKQFEKTTLSNGGNTTEDHKNERANNRNEGDKDCLFSPIDYATFQSVPPLIRRRAKLDDINLIYKTLYDMAIKKGRTGSVKLLSCAGLKKKRKRKTCLASFINKKIKRDKLNFGFQKDEPNLGISNSGKGNGLNWKFNISNNEAGKFFNNKIKAIGGIEENYHDAKVVNNIVENDSCVGEGAEELTNIPVRRQNRNKNISVEQAKKKKKKSYKKMENLICSSDNIKDIKKDIKLFFFKKRIIYLTEEINKKTADELISQLLYLDNLNNNDIKIYINSPGGSINEGLAILDIFNYIKSDIQTISFGLVASMASVILASGKKGKRKSLPNCRIMIHQPLGNAFGHPHDIEIQTKEILYLKKLLYNYLSRFTNQTIETIEKHSDRDYYMNALEAKNYGIIDEVIETKLPHPNFNEVVKE